MMKFPSLFLCVFFKAVLVFGQVTPSGSKIDSFLTYHYHHKFESLQYRDTQRAHQYIDSLMLLSKTNRYQKAKYYYYKTQAAVNFEEYHLDSSFIYYQRAYELAIDHQWQQEAILSQIWLANLEFLRGDLISAKSKYLKILSESKKINFVDGIANAYYGLADLQEDNKNTLEYLIKVDSVYQSHDTISPILANTYNYIGRIYANSFNNRNLAKEYFLKALEISKKTNYDSGIEYITNMVMKLGLEDSEDYNLYDYLNDRFSQYQENKDTIAMARILLQLGRWELHLDQWDLAEKHLQTSLMYFTLLKDETSQNNNYLQLAKIEIKRKNPNNAQRNLDSIQDVEISLKNSAVVEDVLNTKIQLLILKEDYKNALVQQRQLDSLKSVFSNQKNDQAFLEMERRFQTNKKLQEISLLTSKNQLTQEQKDYQKNIFLGILFLLLSVTVLLFALYRNRQRVNRKLEELDVFKSQFYANISHEFRTPLTLLQGPIDKQLENPDLTSERRSELHMMKRNTKRLLNLVNQLLDLSKLESGHLKLQVSKGNLSELLLSLSRSFDYQAAKRNIRFIVKMDKTGQVWFDSDIVEKIIMNLLSNALKYTSEHGEVYFESIVEDDRLMMNIINEGKPLTKDEINRLFDRFYQVDANYEGVGIGLAYVKELVTLSHGRIVVEQLSDTKLKFNIVLPLTKEQFEPHELHYQRHNNRDVAWCETEGLLENETFVDNDLPILLIVEDNSDIRDFIKSSFHEDYHIIEACHGNQGLDLAYEMVPDIIISDVMMPVMDGFEMTTLLKQDERTCHIPIILLTAKAEEIDEFIGLNTGADDYIIKPFRLKLLKTRVKNLLDNRNKLRQRYSQELILKPKAVNIRDLDALFIDKIKIILDANLTEPSFSITDFSKLIGMSRMQLHRKLKALTGLSATELVREQRLALATTLIGKSDVNIAEIGYKVGFSDHSYFTKCFKQAYGCSPSEYKSSKGN